MAPARSRMAFARRGDGNRGRCPSIAKGSRVGDGGLFSMGFADVIAPVPRIRLCTNGRIEYCRGKGDSHLRFAKLTASLCAMSRKREAGGTGRSAASAIYVGGRPVWLVSGEVCATPEGPQGDERWVQLWGTKADDAGFSDLRLGFTRVKGRWIWTGVLLRSPALLTGQRLREIPAISTIAEAAGNFLPGSVPALTVRRRRGRKGHPAEFYLEIGALYDRAISIAPRRPVTHMWRHLLPAEYQDVSEDTVRRWVREMRRRRAASTAAKPIKPRGRKPSAPR